MFQLVNDAAQDNWGGFLSGRGYCFYDTIAAYALMNSTAFTWVDTAVTVRVSQPFDYGSDGLIVSNSTSDTVIKVARINDANAKYFRDVVQMAHWTHPCIHDQPPSFRELQAFWEAHHY